MKNIFKIFSVAVAVLMAAACGPENEGPKVSDAIVAEWHLTDMSGADASAIPQVYIEFKLDKNFELYQKIGEGRYRKYAGTYTLTDAILSGKYSDGAEWGSSYAVSFEGEVLVLTAQNGSAEVCKYEKKSLSQSDKDNAAVVTKADDEQEPRFL